MKSKDDLQDLEQEVAAQGKNDVRQVVQEAYQKAVKNVQSLAKEVEAGHKGKAKAPAELWAQSWHNVISMPVIMLISLLAGSAVTFAVHHLRHLHHSALKAGEEP